MSHTFEAMCVNHIMEGLTDGLSQFSRPTRVALLYARGSEDHVHVVDPTGLLDRSEPKLRELFLYSNRFRQGEADYETVRTIPANDLARMQLNGCIGYAARSKAVDFQAWFVEHHPTVCSVGPILRWMEIASRLFSQNIAAENTQNLESAGFLLQQCEKHAVRDFIVDTRASLGFWDTMLRTYPILECITGVTTTLEEGQRAKGKLVFIEPRDLNKVDYHLRFLVQERPLIKNFKHVRKLLIAVENSSRVLVSDGESILGIAEGGNLPSGIIISNFKGKYGLLSVDDDLVCSFSDVGFSALSRKADLAQFENLLWESFLAPPVRTRLFKIVSELVNAACVGGYGGSFVIDLDTRHIELPGQQLEHWLDLGKPDNIMLAKALSRMDGALYLNGSMSLMAFACLLDGRACLGENRAKGARYNSAVRFTAEHENVIVIVVSSDSPVSIFKNGVELTSACQIIGSCSVGGYPTIEEWSTGLRNR
ncbi:MAG: DNA integrity scanning protein DisA nucleotide-binding domain protein [Desulfovibrio sp.]